ncbi:MAG: alpha-L-fucosidase [Cyclobacteriaceae bacterium]|nr:alpha-L-fucosidase [Cyclobacteriaceae bacterium]
MNITQDQDVQPTQVQQEFLDMKFGMFVHFGINTFYDTEKSDGDLPLFNFDPLMVDTDQWCMTASNCGMKYILMSAKSLDGFCNWPSRHSNYTVAQTPYRKDILEKLIGSANKYGLKTGFSYSLWDRHMETNIRDEDAYEEFMLNQLEELMTSYGPLVELWLDGFWIRQDHGWKNDEGFAASQAKFLKSWRLEGAFRWRWDYLYGTLKKMQPDCHIFLNSTRAFLGLPLFPVDGRNAEKGIDIEINNPVWDWLGEKKYLPLQIEMTLSQKGQDEFEDGNWFWHRSDSSVAKKWRVNSWRNKAEKMNANLLLNVGPSTSGKLRPEDEKILLKIRE